MFQGVCYLVGNHVLFELVKQAFVVISLDHTFNEAIDRFFENRFKLNGHVSQASTWRILKAR